MEAGGSTATVEDGRIGEFVLSTNHAAVLDARRAIALTPVEEPTPAVHEAVVEVATTSLNRGEVRRTLNRAQPGWRPGWDIAGRVVQAAANGTGPAVGTRVLGLLPGSGGWARRVAATATGLAAIPDGVCFSQAACLPVAGLTALHALERGGGLTGRNVLITGATGGVGHFACQLARHSGARVVASVRTQAQMDLARRYGAHAVVTTGTEHGAISAEGPYDLVVESIGGASLEAALKALRPRGQCVVIGVSSGAKVSFDAEAFFYATATLSGLVLFRELETGEGPAAGLTRLLRLVADGRLVPDIAEERPWTEIDAAARDLMDRKVPGKIVVHMDDRI